ncbi:LuxR C-terminal-related transcriptional regulator [Metapseudomonas otitidis]|uniref:helix-turn-helix transcriptional regulator n=1 Tax=Metapseudomonas otitidis TaxID=319939 RepID=UPI003EE1E4F1
MNMHLTEWTRSITHVLARPAGEPQLRALAAWLVEVVPADHLVVFLHEGSAAPVALVDTFTEAQRALFVSAYRAGPYLLDPLYLHLLFGNPDGVQTMQALAPASFHSNHYYHAHYQRLALGDELAVSTTPGEGCRAKLSLMRNAGQPAFSAAEQSRARDAWPVVDEVLRAAWCKREAAVRAMPLLNEQVRAALAVFGAGLLSVREAEIARLLLLGHVPALIGRLLRISPSTVRVHRRNLYEKLGVTSQVQLLGLFLHGLMEEGAAPAIRRCSSDT